MADKIIARCCLPFSCCCRPFSCLFKHSKSSKSSHKGSLDPHASAPATVIYASAKAHEPGAPAREPAAVGEPAHELAGVDGPVSVDAPTDAHNPDALAGEPASIGESAGIAEPTYVDPRADIGEPAEVNETAGVDRSSQTAAEHNLQPESCQPTSDSERSPGMQAIISKTGWAALYEVFKITKEALALFPPLQAAVGGLLSTMELFKIVGDADSGFADLANKCKDLETILGNHIPGSSSSSALNSRLEMLEQAIMFVTDSLNAKAERGLARRILESREDVKFIQSMFTHLSFSISRIQLDLSINAMQISEAIQKDTSSLVSEGKLAKLHHVRGASIAMQDRRLSCLPKTRVDILVKLLDWAQDRRPDSPRVLWLSGMAGTGKSAIARSFCYRLEEAGTLGASFFCSRNSAELSSALRIIPTLAYHLAHRIARYRTTLLSTLQDIIDPSDMMADRQFDALVTGPLQGENLDSNRQGCPVIVIDAVDECSDPNTVVLLLHTLLSTTASGSLPLKFFITGRPELPMRRTFEHSSSRVIHLHETRENVIEADIIRFFDERFRDIRRIHRLESDWPGDSIVRELAKRAGKLFIIASTACSFLEYLDPRKRLSVLLAGSSAQEKPPTGYLDDMYSLILDQATGSDKLMVSEAETLRRILSHIILLRQSLTVPALGSLMELSPGEVRDTLQELHAVISVPVEGDDEGLVFALHASFGDFLTDIQRAKRHFIAQPSAHFSIAHNCLNVMVSELRFNIANCRSSYLENSAQEHQLLPQHLVYACLNFSQHVDAASDVLKLLERVEVVFRERFLYWLEVLSLSGSAYNASVLIRVLLSRIAAISQIPPRTADFAEFLRDGDVFVNSAADVIALSVPHIYLSALPTAHSAHRVYKELHSHFPRTLYLKVHNSTKHNQPPRRLFGHSSAVNSVAFSPDGKRIISGSWDNTIRAWDAATGEELLAPFEGHTNFVNSVAFSTDGSRIVSGSRDDTIRVWDAITGKEVFAPLKGHANFVNSVAFSPDGTRIVSGSDDDTIRVWDVTICQETFAPLKGHTKSVKSVAFSPDRMRIASGSWDDTIRVWDATTGKEILSPLIGHTKPVNSVAFSPDGTRIVSGSWDDTIRVWDARTGRKMLMPFKGHTGTVNSVAFSSDGTRIVSGSDDDTIRVWDAAIGKEMFAPLKGHTKAVNSVAFSPDGKRIVSGSNDNTIRVWDATIGMEILVPLERNPDLIKLDAFPPDGKPTRLPSSSMVDSMLAVNTSDVSKLGMSRNSSVQSCVSGTRHFHGRSPLLQLDLTRSDGGWIKGPGGELLFWVPPEFHSGLYWPRSTLAIGSSRVYVDLTRFVYGENWIRCQEPLASTPED